VWNHLKAGEQVEASDWGTRSEAKRGHRGAEHHRPGAAPGERPTAAHMRHDRITNQRSHEGLREMPRAPARKIEQTGFGHACCEERVIRMLAREHWQESCRDTNPFALRRA
jgi:hypothetical protein